MSGWDASDVKYRCRWSESSKTNAPSRVPIGAYSALSADAPWMSMSMSPAATEAIRSASPPSWLAPKILVVSADVGGGELVGDHLGAALVLRLRIL